MAWVLQFDGVNDYAVMNSSASLSVGEKIIIKAKADTGNAGNTYRLLGRDDNYLSLIELTPTVVSIRLNDTNTRTVSNGYVQPPVGVWFVLEMFRIDSSTYEISLDGSSLGQIASGLSFLPNCIGAFNKAFFFAGQIEYITNGTVNNWSADASSHGAGAPVLTDIISGNDATGVNMPTDGSAWEEIGGGGGFESQWAVNSNILIG